MTFSARRFLPIAIALGLFACKADDETSIEQCENLCQNTRASCSDDPAFADPWELSCTVACALDLNDETQPLQTCINGSATCEEKADCVNPGPGPGPGLGEGTDDGMDGVLNTGPGNDDNTDDDGPGVDTGMTDDGAGESTDGGVQGHVCCDISGAPCPDEAVLECTCEHMPECCNGNWGESCANVAVANDCIQEGCSTLERLSVWTCNCDTAAVFCPEDPFISQIFFFTDACGVDQADALATAEAACEQGSGDGCEIGPGSCNCECATTPEGCGLQPE